MEWVIVLCWAALKVSKVVQALAPWGGGWVGECSCSVVQKNRVGGGGGLVAANRVCKCVCVGGGGGGGGLCSPVTNDYLFHCVFLCGVEELDGPGNKRLP